MWNLLLAGARDPEATAAVALPVSALVAAPFAVLYWELDAGAWPYIAASSALELAYFALLAAAYARAELSLVYPLARGLAPVLVLAAAVTVTGAPTSAPQVLGVSLVASGVLLVRGLRRGRGAGFALAIAASIAAYTVVDNAGVEHASPLAYLELVTLFTGVGYAAGIAAVRGRP
ncbi:MAG: EamA family transporter, partial [Actinobacteria bacterium]|nr:EamA family transporter [Actinomycetota bacterium]